MDKIEPIEPLCWCGSTGVW